MIEIIINDPFRDVIISSILEISCVHHVKVSREKKTNIQPRLFLDSSEKYKHVSYKETEDDHLILNGEVDAGRFAGTEYLL